MHTSDSTIPNLSTPSAPVSVVILHSSDDLYGSDRVLLELLSRFDRNRLRPVVVLPKDMEHVGLLSRELRERGIEVHHLPTAVVRRRYLSPIGLVRFLANFWQGSKLVVKLVREKNAKVIYGFTFAVLAAPFASLLSGVPLVMHAHEVLVRPAFVRRTLHKLFSSCSKRVLCVSEAVRENILRDVHNPEAKLEVVYNGLTIKRDSNASCNGLEQLGICMDLPVVGMVGRVSHWKGQEVFLRAAALVRDSGAQCQFICIGGVFDGATEPLDSLLALRSRLGMEREFIVEGFRRDAPELVGSFDALVVPSTLPEPFGMVILEAMAAGVPVVASAHGGPLEILEHGKSGWLVEPSNPQALAVAISTLLSDPEQRFRLGQAGKRRFEALFTVEKQVAHVESVLQQTAGVVSPSTYHDVVKV